MVFSEAQSRDTNVAAIELIRATLFLPSIGGTFVSRQHHTSYGYLANMGLRPAPQKSSLCVLCGFARNITCIPGGKRMLHTGAL